MSSNRGIIVNIPILDYIAVKGGSVVLVYGLKLSYYLFFPKKFSLLSHFFILIDILFYLINDRVELSQI